MDTNKHPEDNTPREDLDDLFGEEPGLEEIAEEYKKGPEETLKPNIRRDFLYGLIVILPIIATIWIVSVTINLISGPISSLFGQKIPVLVSFVITLVLITVIGVLARNILGRAVLNFVENLVKRIPIINTVYRSTKHIVSAFTVSNRNLLHAVLVEYPRKGMWALGFITRDTVTGLVDITGKDISKGKIALFIPTTPNPTSGYFVYVDEKDVVRLSMSVEDSIKVLMSAGVASPGEKQ